MLIPSRISSILTHPIYTNSVAEFLPPEFADLKGIEEKVLRERRP